MKKLTIPSCAEEKIKKGQFVIEKQDFPSLPFHHQAVELINTKGQFVGIAYLSEQNKGIGWFISHKKITFDIPFFCQLFQHAKKSGKFINNLKKRQLTVFLIKKEMGLVVLQ